MKLQSGMLKAQVFLKSCSTNYAGCIDPNPKP